MSIQEDVMERIISAARKAFNASWEKVGLEATRDNFTGVSLANPLDDAVRAAMEELQITHDIIGRQFKP